MKETRPLWPPQRGVGLQEPNLGKTNLRVSLAYSLGICFVPSLSDSFIFLTLTPACSCVYICKFQFRPIHPPSRRLSKTFDASYVLTNKSSKIVAKYVGGKHKGSKTCVWVPKVLVSNVKGPKAVWVPKNKA